MGLASQCCSTERGMSHTQWDELHLRSRLTESLRCPVLRGREQPAGVPREAPHGPARGINSAELRCPTPIDRCDPTNGSKGAEHCVASVLFP
jgi:hypothetical protein